MRHYACVVSYVFVTGFFFQAEDGIRDLVRSRGLGDVYKRQHVADRPVDERHAKADGCDLERPGVVARAVLYQVAVSYTHLTLPTSDLV